MPSRLVLALIGTAGLLFGCSDPGGISERVRVEAHVLTPTVEAGDSVAVRLVVINPTSRDITVTSPNAHLFAVFVFNTIGEQVGGTNTGGSYISADFTIPARDSVAETLPWNGLIRSNGTVVLAPAGVYTVRGAVAGVPRMSAPHLVTVR